MATSQQSSIAALKAKQKAPVITKKLVKKTVLPNAPFQSQRHSITSRPPARPSVNGHTKAADTRRSGTPASRQASKEPIERLKTERAGKSKRPSPAATTPHFDTDDEDEDEQGTKRRKLEDIVDPTRSIRDQQAFVDDISGDIAMVHAFDIANDKLEEHQRIKYETYFTTLDPEEDDSPTVQLQYPGAALKERYQILQPVDKSDFRPITEMFDNMKMVAEYYLSGSDSEKVFCEEDGSGYAQKLRKHFNEGASSRLGAQSRFLAVLDQYNSFIQAKREDGTIAKKLDSMHSVPLPLVEHIVKGQVYARTVSPNVNLVRQYEGFSDNVYGELLPKFLSRIFKETRLKPSQTFVDLGSGVGNCVLQAALETGCEAWGCEMMENCAKLAGLQASEFSARCHLWGLKPGSVNLLRDNFMENEQINEVLKRADVVLINNQAFTADLNNNLKLKFLDLKEGCQIVSLKYYRDPGAVIKVTNVNDPVNFLKVKKMERFSGMVSWSDDPGYWYLHRKDSREVQRFMEASRRS